LSPAKKKKAGPLSGPAFEITQKGLLHRYFEHFELNGVVTFSPVVK
jgi:hypothetical protein